APVVGVLLPVIARLVALLLALLLVLLPLILALPLSLGALVLVGLALLGGSEPRASLVLPLRRRVAVVLPSVSTGLVVARRPLTAQRAPPTCSPPLPPPPPSARLGGARPRCSVAGQPPPPARQPSPASAAATSPAPTASARRGHGHRGDQHQDHDEPGGRGSCGDPHGWASDFGTRKGISCAPSAGVKVKTLSGTSGARFQCLKFASYCG